MYMQSLSAFALATKPYFLSLAAEFQLYQQKTYLINLSLFIQINRVCLRYLNHILQYTLDRIQKIGMQFSFKRPQTSKSLQTHLNRDRSPLPTTNLQSPPTFEVSNTIKKWEEAAQRINKEMIYHRAMHNNTQSFKLLARIGGRTYNSQSKESKQQEHSKPRVRISSKQKGSRVILRESREFKVAEDDFPKEAKGDTKLKRKKRGQLFKGVPLEKELKITNIFYENPVVKIGFNMQFDAKLKIKHISQIKPQSITGVCRNSIIFFVKDAPFNPNIISEKNTQMPISLSLFPQFFDSKLSVSHKKRQQYLQKMLQLMNGTYDPEQMSKIRPFSTYPAFKEEYFNIARQLMNIPAEEYPPKLLQGIVKMVRVNLSPWAFKDFVKQQWQIWSLGNAISNLDYILKDPKAMNKLQLVPYLPTRTITSKKILYHGGYCKSIYVSWNKYVQNGRRKLSNKLNKYNNTIQAIHGWYRQFEGVLLFEPHFVTLLGSPVPLTLFHCLQRIKIKHALSAMEQIWFRGALTLYHYGRYLQRHKKEYYRLIGYQRHLQGYIDEAKIRAQSLGSDEERNNFYSTSYQNFVFSLRRRSQISCLEQLQPCKDIVSIADCQVSNLQVLLNIQLGEMIQNSFRMLQRQIMEPGQLPLIRLNLIIDRQTIKFMEQEDQIVNSFLQIISEILNAKIIGFNLKCNFQASKPAQKTSQLAQTIKECTSSEEPEIFLKEYPQIMPASSLDSEDDRKITLAYKNGFIFDKDIRELIETLREYYRECYSILSEFQTYLPFIKLTTTQKLFGQNEGHDETSFLKNLKIIAKYKESIKLLEKRVKINLFQVDCSIPIKTLQERINEIEYIIEQNYINIIHERIQAMDSELNSIKIDLYNAGVSLGSKESEQKLNMIKARMEGLQGKSKRVAEMVIFCLDNKRKMETMISCYCQLVIKKQELQKQLQRLFLNLQLKKPEFEAEQEGLLTETFRDIDRTIHSLSQTEATPFELSNLPEHLNILNGIKLKLDQIEHEIQQCEEWAQRSSNSGVFLQKIEVFQRERQRFALAQQFWEQFHRFTSYYKDIAKIEARKLNFQDFQTRVQSGENIIQKLKDAEKKQMHDENIARSKPVIHPTHEYFYTRFQTDLNMFRQIEPYLQILTNHKIKDRHWSLYAVQQFKGMTCRDLSKVQRGYKWSQLSTMNSEVNFEYEIWLAYEDIEKQIRSHCLIIVDLKNSDVLDLENIRQCLQFLHNIEIEIQLLRLKDVNGYYASELVQLKQLAFITQAKLNDWLEIEQKYIDYLRYHIANEEYESSLFQTLLELHRKLIKSYDIDNSILFISKNIVMDTYLFQIKEQLEELDQRLSSSLSQVRQEYPRLYLLEDQELFAFMSSGADVGFYLKRLFPHILKFHVNDGTIEKIGLKKQLCFNEPLFFQEMAGRVNVWVSKLEEDIKLKMKQMYKASVLLSEDKNDNEIQNDFLENRPLQLILLDECVKFTEAASQKGLQGTVPSLIAELTQKIEYITKETKEVNKILLLILLRSWAEKLSRTHPDTFQWNVIPQFLRKGPLLEPKIAILNRQYAYGFNFLQECQIIFTDNVFLGNCLVGEGQIGKGSIMRHYSYLCGQELVQLNPLSLHIQETPTAHLLSYLKVVASTGAWLFVRRLDRLSEGQLSLIAQCMITIADSLRDQSPKVSLNGMQLNLNKNVCVFMSVQSLAHCEFPARLISQLRPIWIIPPNKSLLLSIYMQSKGLTNVQTGRLLNFLSWLDDRDQPKLSLLDWIRREETPDVFTGSNILGALSQSTVFKSSECQSLIQYLKHEQLSLSGLQSPQVKLNIAVQISRHPIVAIYGPSGCGKTKEVIQTLGQNWMLLNNQSCLSDSQFFKQIRGFENLSKEIKSGQNLILKNSIAYWPLISIHLKKYRVIMIEQDLSQLHIGLLHHFKLLDFTRILRQNNSLKSLSTVQSHLPYIVSKADIAKEIYQLINTPHSVPAKIISKVQMTISQQYFYGVSTHQLAINFLRLMKSMIDQGYGQVVSFVFAIIWTYGFSIEENRLEDILKDITMPEFQTGIPKLVKLTSEPGTKVSSKKYIEEQIMATIRQCLANKVGPLAELIPLKTERLVSGSEANEMIGIINQSQFFDGVKVNFKSNLLYNVKLVRQTYKGAITIDARDWLTTFVKSCSPGARYCNFGKKTPKNIFRQLFQDTKKTGITYHLSNPNIVIDDLHLSHQTSLGRLKDLLEYGFVSLQQEGKLTLFKTKGVIWTLGTKFGFPILRKNLTVRIQQMLLTTIFNSYVQSYCEQHLQVDRSIYTVLNVSSNITRFYKDQQQRFFWFKNPLILVQQAKCSTLTQFIEAYFDFLMESLPQQNLSLQVQRNMLDLKPNLALNDSESEPNLINSNQKFTRFISQRKLIQQLLSDNEIMEEVQARQIEPIYFQKFVKSYFTKQLLSYTKKISRYLQTHSLVVLYNNSHPVHRIVRYAVKLSKGELITFSQKNSYLRNGIHLIELQQAEEATLQEIQRIMKDMTRNPKVRVIVMAEIDSQYTQQSFKKYPFLKSHFLNIVIPWLPPSQDIQDQKVNVSQNFVEENWQNNRYIQRLQQLIAHQQLDNNFKQQFLKVFQVVRKKELGKFQFYRKITSEMVVSIDKISKVLTDMPTYLADLRSKQTTTKVARRRAADDVKEIKAKIDHWQLRFQKTEQLLTYRTEEDIISLQKLIQNAQAIHQKMDKLEKKIETQDHVEYSRLKNNLKNNQNNNIVQNLHLLLGFIYEKTQNYGVKDKGAVISAISSPGTLASFLKGIRKRQNYEREGQDGQKVTTSLTKGRIAHLLGKIEEIEGNNKKYEKVSIIYKSLVAWIALYSQLANSLNEYIHKKAEIENKIAADLADLFHDRNKQAIQHMSKGIYINIAELRSVNEQAKRNLIECQEQLYEVQTYIKTQEQEGKRLEKMENFYEQRQQRLQRISQALSRSEYMKKVSSAVSLYFKHLQQIVFSRTLSIVSLTEFQINEIDDLQFARGIYTFRQDLFHLRQKTGVGGPLKEIEILQTLVNDPVKEASFVEDKQGLFKAKMVTLAESKGYLVKPFSQRHYEPILVWIQQKLNQNPFIVILHQNIHYLEAQRTDNKHLFNKFANNLIKMTHGTNKRILYITNYLPKIDSLMYSKATVGRIKVSRQRLFNDLCEAFEIMNSKDSQRESKTKKLRTDIQAVIKERNSKMKQILSSIEMLGNCLQSQNQVEVLSAQKIEDEKNCCQVLENNFINLELLEAQLQYIQRINYSIYYLPSACWRQIQKQLDRYHLLYKFTDLISSDTNNQLTPTHELYSDWNAILKKFRQEKLSFFTRSDYRPIINEISIKEDGEEVKKINQSANPLKATQQQETKVLEMVLNSNFRKHNTEIFNHLAQKIIRGASWIDRASLVRYTVGIAAILSLTRCGFKWEEILKLLQRSKGLKMQQIRDICKQILEKSSNERYNLTQFGGQYLILELNRLVNSGENGLHLQAAIFLGIYYNLGIDPHLANQHNFIECFKVTLDQKGIFSYRYSPLQLAYTIKLTGQVAVRLTEPLSLSLNFQTRAGQRQRLISIIQEERYLVNELVNVLRVKALSRKRQFLILLVNMQKKQELLQTLKSLYVSSTKRWVYLSNVPVHNNWNQMGTFLQEIIEELQRLPNNPFFRIFLIGPTQPEGLHLFYNKYEISRFKSNHTMNDDDYYHLFNNITSSELSKGSNRKTKHRIGKDYEQGQQNLGLQLIEQLIVTTINQDKALIQEKLQGLMVFFKKITKKYNIFSCLDFKLWYTLIVEELGQLSYLQEETDDNFYQFLSNYFSLIPELSAKAVKECIEAEKELCKQGLYNTIIFHNQELKQKRNASAITLEKISLYKIEEYFKNIGSQFAEMIRRQISINNRLLAQQSIADELQRLSLLPPSVVFQTWRNYRMKFGAEAVQSEITAKTYRQKLPLQRFLNNIKLKQICTTKKLELLNCNELMNFLTAYQFKFVKEFMQRQVTPEDIRYSSVQFGNYIHARDYLSKMKIVLIDEESYQQINLVEEEITQALQRESKTDGRYVVTIRKNQGMKISELNNERDQIQKIFEAFTCTLLFESELIMELSIK